jgi:four helix bundle protein
MNRFKNLEIWQRTITLSTDIYRVTSNFPKAEKYGLVSQLRRCVVSIASNIAEGAGRNTNKDFKKISQLVIWIRL